MEQVIPIPVWLQIALLVGSVLGALATIVSTIRIIRKWARHISEGLDSVGRLFSFLQAEYSPNHGQSHKDYLIISSENDKKIIELLERIAAKLDVHPAVNISVSGDKDVRKE